MLERSWQLAFRNGFHDDDLVELCVDVASRGGRAIVDASAWSPAAIIDDSVSGLAPGARADLVVVAADTVTAAVMDHPPRSHVIRHGDVSPAMASCAESLPTAWGSCDRELEAVGRGEGAFEMHSRGRVGTRPGLVLFYCTTTHIHERWRHD